jgi:hypothetical protein
MKLHNNFNSDSFTLWIYSGRVIDIIHNNSTHLCVFVSCCWLLNMTVSGIPAPWHGEDACELTTDWGSLFPEALSQVQMQESDPGLLKPSYTLSFCCAVPGYSIKGGKWSAISWIGHPPGKELNFIGHVYRGGDFQHNPWLLQPCWSCSSSCRRLFSTNSLDDGLTFRYIMNSKNLMQIYK